MLDILFVVLIILYAVTSTKVDQWVAITKLDLKIFTPAGFAEHPLIYGLVRWSLFFAAATTLHGTVVMPWYFGFVTLVVVAFGAALIGQRKAFETYRQFWREDIADAKTPDDRSWLEAESRKTDAELRARISGVRMPGT